MEKQKLKYPFFFLLLLFLNTTSCEKEGITEKIEVNKYEEINSNNSQQLLNDSVSITEILKTFKRENLYGNEYEGGVIFFIDENESTYIVPNLLGKKERLLTSLAGNWGCSNRPSLNGTVDSLTKISGANGTAIGTGKINTDAMCNHCSTFSLNDDIHDIFSQKICGMNIPKYFTDYDGSLDGYDDWFLASKDELKKLYQLHISGLNILNPMATYWTSSQIDAENSWALPMRDESFVSYGKDGIASFAIIRIAN